MGYGNAAGCVIFLTSFLGVLLFRRCMNDVLLILLGMISFASGIFFMAFVRTTTTFYLGRKRLDFHFRKFESDFVAAPASLSGLSEGTDLSDTLRQRGGELDLLSSPPCSSLPQPVCPHPPANNQIRAVQTGSQLFVW